MIFLILGLLAVLLAVISLFPNTPDKYLHGVAIVLVGVSIALIGRV